jgi:uncharacterized protein YycO
MEEIDNSLIEFLAYHGTSFISRGIQFQTWAGLFPPGVSHIGIRHRDQTVTEAWVGGVQHVESYKTLHTKGTKVDVYRYHIGPWTPTIETVKNAEKWLACQVGKPYDYMGIVHFMDRHSHDDTKRWFCSKLAVSFAVKLGFPVFNEDTTPEYKISPVVFTYSPELYLHDTIKV